jgi:hypothetical protein
MITTTSVNVNPCKGLYQIGAYACLIVILVALLDLGLTFVPSAATPDPGEGSVLDWFNLLQASPFLGLRGLGLWNILTIASSALLFLALYAAHQRLHPSASLLVAAILVAGAVIYIANNRALAMLHLSRQYALASGDAFRSQLLAAGRVLLAQAEDFTPGTFLSFFLADLAGLLMALLMLRSGLLGKTAAWLGLCGFTLMLVFTIWASFIPVYYSAALLLSALAGLLITGWYALVARGLFRLARHADLSD